MLYLVSPPHGKMYLVRHGLRAIVAGENVHTTVDDLLQKNR